MKKISHNILGKLLFVILFFSLYSCVMFADITVNGVGKVAVDPDLATFDIAIETKNQEAQIASLENAKQTGKIIKELKKLIKEKDAVTTQGYAVYQDYEYDNKTQSSKVVGFKTVNQVHIKTRDLEKLGNLLDSAVSMGVTKINNLQFTYQNQEVILHKALTNAVLNATERAKTLASAGSLRLDGILSIDSTVNNSHAPRPMNTMLMAMKAAPLTPIEPGSIAVEASVNVVFKTKKA